MAKPLVKSKFDRSIIRTYTCGACYVLAHKLNEMFMYEYIHLDYDATHVAVLLDDRTVLDVEGIWDLRDFTEHWHGFGIDENTVVIGKIPSRHYRYQPGEIRCRDVCDIARSLRKLVEKNYTTIKCRK